MFEFKAISSNHALPQPQPYQQLPHSLKRSISNSFTLNDLRTLSKTPGVYPFSSHFGTRPDSLRPPGTVNGFAITPFAPPCRNAPPPYTIKPTGAPRLSCRRDRVIRFFK